jgi:hypothetical protein
MTQQTCVSDDCDRELYAGFGYCSICIKERSATGEPDQ